MNNVHSSLRAAGAVALACATSLAASGAVAAAQGGTHQVRRSPQHSRPHQVRVTVKVFGAAPAYKRLLDRTVKLTGKPVVKDGGSCSGYTAAGALQLASKGQWSGTWNAEYADYEVRKIDGLTLSFNSKSSADWYWSFDISGKEASAGVCGVKPKSGQTIVFKPACYGKSCPKAGKASRVTDAADRRRR